MAAKGALATLDDDKAINQIANGMLLKQIAAQYGATKQSLHARLSKHPEYPRAVTLQAESFVEDAFEEVMNVPPDMTDIARARARYDAAFKWAAARDPKAWGNKTQIEHTGSVTVTHTVKTDLSSLIAQSIAVAPMTHEGESLRITDVMSSARIQQTDGANDGDADQRQAIAQDAQP